MSRANGYFEAYVNARAYRRSAADRELIATVTAVVREVVAGSQVHWAGSQRKRTAIEGSDLDLCVESTSPITDSQRRDLRRKVEVALDRPAVVHRHVIRLPAHTSGARVDIAFANAAFGSRPLPDLRPFHDQRARQMAARAMKLWTRAGNLPHLPGWVVEALVVHLDPHPRTYASLELFMRIVGWLESRATPDALEAVLRPAAHPSWNPDWSPRLPGRLEAVQNHARALLRRSPAPQTWRRADDVERWLRG